MLIRLRIVCDCFCVPAAQLNSGAEILACQAEHIYCQVLYGKSLPSPKLERRVNVHFFLCLTLKYPVRKLFAKAVWVSSFL